MIRQLRRKFILVNMLIATSMLLGIFALMLRFTTLNLERQSEGILRMVIEDRHTPAFSPGNRRDQVQLPSFCVSVDHTGAVTAVTGNYFDLSDPEGLAALVKKAAALESSSGLLREDNLRYLKQASPFGLRIAFVDVSSEIAMVKGLGRNCLIVGGLSFFFLLVLSFRLSKWAVAPVEEAWNRQRQFIADSSHELKTPLTVILANTELLQSQPHSPEETRLLSGIAAMSSQMRALVEGLLELARLDNGTARLEFQPLDLSRLAEEVLLPFEPVYFERGLTLEGQIQPGITVLGSAAQLRQVLDILLDNGAKYASGGTVLLRLSRQGSHCLLQVTSQGNPIQPEDLKNIFKRFYRIDKVRGRSGSYGLGLAIAESIVQAHGGKIWAESSGGINRFYIRLDTCRMYLPS